MKTILVVDDEYALVENLTELLQDEGYRVVSAANGKDGLVRAEAESPNLVLTDFMMPIANGQELILAMRAVPALSNVPVVMMSATKKAIALATADGGRLEIAGFIAKPMSWDALRKLIVTLIGAP